MQNRVTMKFDGTTKAEFITCQWTINLPEGVSGKPIIDTRDWANRSVEVREPARIFIRRENPDETAPEYTLVIKGRGSDERCTWCRSFRTALKTRLKKENKELEQIGACEFGDITVQKGVCLWCGKELSEDSENKIECKECANS